MDSIDNNILAAEPAEDTLETIMRSARTHRRSCPVRYNTLLQVQLELRKQRKRLLGSNVPFSAFLYPSGRMLHAGIADLIEYLSHRTLALWKKPQGEHLRFCRQFYELCFSCPTYVTLDDIILFATTLVHSEKDVFLYVMQELLPDRYHDMLQSFTLDFPDDFYEAPFEDAVLGAICIFLGVIKDNLEEEGK